MFTDVATISVKPPFERTTKTFSSVMSVSSAVSGNVSRIVTGMARFVLIGLTRTVLAIRVVLGALISAGAP
jgi:hypothetical protein